MATSTTLATKVKGFIKDIYGEPLAFTTISVKNETIGTLANAEGYFILNLPPDKTYTLVFQYLGYQTQTKVINLVKDELELHIILEKQQYLLNELTIKKGKEDPANEIIRKAIAKSKIHDLQVESFNADVYARNTFLFHSVPTLFKKQLEKSNIKLNIPFLTESLVNIVFSQPNKRVTHVLAKQTSFEGLDISTAFYLVNFYNPATEISTVSPISTKAFNYYKFEYLGYFEDQGRVINKIQIIPKTFGPGVYKGTINIIDELWAIHSISVQTINQGLDLNLSQLYAPYEGVWIPVSQKIDFGGKIFGFDFTANLQLYPKYNEIIVTPQLATKIKIVNEPSLKSQETEKEYTLKELRKFNKDLEKNSSQNKRIISIDSLTYDTLATKRDSSYWTNARTVPLSNAEIKAYAYGDSLKQNKDSTKKASQPWLKFIYGKQVKINQKYQLKYTLPFLPLVGVNYNIVEGVFSEAQFKLSKQNSLVWENLLGYSFGLNKPKLKTELTVNKYKNSFSAGGGFYNKGFDQEQVMPTYANTLLNLFNLNLTQLYRFAGVNLGYAFKNSESFRFSTTLGYAKRSELHNLPNLKPLLGNYAPTPNLPTNLELGTTNFKKHSILEWSNQINFIPGARYRIKNGIKKFDHSPWPEFSLKYKKGMAQVNYDFLSISAKQSLTSEAGNRLKYYIETGSFLNAKKLYLMDLRHVNSTSVGNNTIGIFEFYRMLNTTLPLQISPDNYYKYSTKNTFIKLHGIQEFRKFIFTQIPLARFSGIKEDLFLNYLKTTQKPNYLELGYGIDGIFKLLRLEVLTAIEKGQKPRWGWQLGVTL